MLKKKLFFILCFLLFLKNFATYQKLVMLSPAGGQNVGRKLIEGYERGQAFKCAEKLKQELQKAYNVRCILTRYPGEKTVYLQDPSFANRLNVDFYLSLHMYREESVKPKLFLYNLVYNPLVDLFQKNFNSFSFVSIFQAHFKNSNRTKFLGESIKNILTSDSYVKRLDFYGPYGIPVKPLCGIVAPALLLELGICEENMWQSLLGPIVQSLSFLNEI